MADFPILKKLISFIVPVLITKIEGETGQLLEIWLINGRLVMDSGNANYSFGALHDVMKKAIQSAGINPTKSEKLLLLGLGGGSVVDIIRNHLKSDVMIHAVEYDKTVVRMAEQYFHFSKYIQVETTVADAFDYVNDCKENYHYIIMDIFIGKTVPEEFLSKSYLKNLDARLNARGTLIFNTMLGGQDTALAAFRNNFTGVFPHYAEVSIGDENVVFIGRK
jgi:spermidine synthase